MAVAVAIGSIVTADPGAGIDNTSRAIIVRGTLTLTANYGGAASHGDTVNLAGLVASDYIPLLVNVYEDQGAGSAPLGYSYVYAHGTTQANGVLTILGGAAGAGQGGQELTQGNAYSSFTPTLNNAVLRFEAYFAKSI